MVTKNNYILIDSDAGSDDALAIMMTIAAHREPSSPVHVVGITCASGNASAENVARNVMHTLHSLNEDNIPVFIGARQPLVHPFVSPIENFHGEDGFGDCDLPPLNYKKVKNYMEEHGVLAMCRLAKEYEGHLTVLALAPLTNLAMAARLDPDICKRLKAIYMMGGNVEGEGNVTVSAEFNFAVDPEAAFITLSSFSCPIHLVPWEVTARAAIPYEWRIKVLGGVQSSQAALLNAVEGKNLEKYKNAWIACDQYAAAAAIEPKVMKTTVDRHCTVELSGNLTRGLMVVDNVLWSSVGFLGQPNNVIVIKELEEELCKRMMMWGIGGCKHYLED